MKYDIISEDKLKNKEIYNIQEGENNAIQK